MVRWHLLQSANGSEQTGKPHRTRSSTTTMMMITISPMMPIPVPRARSGAASNGVMRLTFPRAAAPKPAAARLLPTNFGHARRDDTRGRVSRRLPDRNRTPPAAREGRRAGAGAPHRSRRRRRAAAYDRVQPAPGGLDRQALPRTRRPPYRPDPGRHRRADPGRRQVRLAPRPQVFDLRHLVDPPGRPAQRAQPRPADPGAGAHR